MKWEYKVVHLTKYNQDPPSITSFLDSLGLKSWDLVAVQDGLAFFKRTSKTANEQANERFWREKVGCAPPF